MKNTKIKSKLFEKKSLEIFNYLIKFLILSLPIILIIRLDLYFIQLFYAFVNNFLLNILGLESVLFGSFSESGISPSLYFNQKVIRIDSACTGIRSFYFLFVMLFAFKAKLNKKFKYLLIGFLAIIIVNIIRILISSLLFFNGIIGFDSFIWATSLNLTAFIVVYFFTRN